MTTASRLKNGLANGPPIGITAVRLGDHPARTGASGPDAGRRNQISPMTQRLDYTAIAPAGIKALGSVYGYIVQSGLPRLLVNLVYLRTSQINGCAYCIDMHSRDLISRPGRRDARRRARLHDRIGARSRAHGHVFLGRQHVVALGPRHSARTVLAIAQMETHLVFFLHITTGPDNTNNVLALAFGILFALLVVPVRC
jgi:AhpD family alkylhydroperoxidase